MEITNSKKFNKFISEKREDTFRILSSRIKFPMSKDEKSEVFQNSAIALYNKIDKGILTTLKCRQKHDGLIQDVELPVLADEATPTLLSYFAEICYRQALKLKEKKYGEGVNASSSKKARLFLMKSLGMAKDNDFADLTLNYTGYQKEESSKQYVEMDGSISNEQCMEILNMCSESDNSIYREIMSQALDTLATRCRELLGSYYAHKRTTWSEIASLFDIKGGASHAKVAAQRCRERLTEKCHEIERKRIW